MASTNRAAVRPASVLAAEAHRGRESYPDNPERLSSGAKDAFISGTTISSSPTVWGAQGTTRSRPLRLIIPSKAYNRLWVLMFTVKLLNAGHLFLLAHIYLVYNTKSRSFLRMLVTTFLSKPEVRFMDTFSVWIGATYGLLCFVFIAHCVRMLALSLYHRQLWFGNPPSDNAIVIRDTMSDQFDRDSVQSENTSRWRVVTRTARLSRRFLRKLLAVWVDHGVRGKNFERGMLLRESAEMIMQTLQAYKASLAISNMHILRCYGVVVTLSGVVHPLLARACAHNMPLHRFACVFTEFFLDVAWGCVLPLWMFAPYLTLNLSTTKESIVNENPLGYHEMAQSEVRQTLVFSVEAYVLSVFPFVSALISLQGVNRLLSGSIRRETVAGTMMEHRPERVMYRSSRGNVIPQLSPDPIAATADRSQEKAAALNGPVAAFGAPSTRLIRVAYAVITACAFLILSISLYSTTHISSTRRITGPACVYRMSPWFVREDACVMWILNCEEWRVTGRQHELSQILPYIHHKTLSAIVFDECSALEIPGDIVQLQHLVTIVIANSHLSHWATDASLTAAHFPRLSRIFLQDVSIAQALATPSGLAFPMWSDSIETFVASNVAEMDRVTGDITTQWRSLITWSCFACTSTTFPSVLFASTKLEHLTLIGSSISDLSSVPGADGTSVMWPSLTSLDLAENRHLAALPETIWSIAGAGRLQILNLQATNVSTVPDKWLRRLPRALSISAFDSPLCQNLTLRAALPQLSCTQQ